MVEPRSSNNVPDHAASDSDKDIVRNKTQKFLTWCNDVGIICPKLEYPYFFEGGLVGVRVKETIKHRETFIYVPQTVIITISTCH